MDCLRDRHFVMVLSAPRGSGKSFFIKALLSTDLEQEYDNIVVFCPSIDFNEDYDFVKHNPKYTLIAHISTDTFEELIHKQMECKKMVRDTPQVNHQCPSLLIILDDCIDSSVMNFRGVVDKVAERGRHFDTSLIMTTQRMSAVSRSIRINTEQFVLFLPFSITELDQFLEQFVGKNKRDALRQKTLEIFSEEYSFILLDNTEKKIRQKLKYGTADAYMNNSLLPIQL